jgi:hypothetical protein
MISDPAGAALLREVARRVRLHVTGGDSGGRPKAFESAHRP